MFDKVIFVLIFLLCLDDFLHRAFPPKKQQTQMMCESISQTEDKILKKCFIYGERNDRIQKSVGEQVQRYL